MAKASVSLSSEKTFYREEEEEVTYITYHSPKKKEGYAYTLKQRTNAEQGEDEQLGRDKDPPVQIYNTATNYRMVRLREPLRRTSGSNKWKVVAVLLLLAALAAATYYVYFI